MARSLRDPIGPGFFHITARGNRRQKIALDSHDYRRFVTELADVCRRFEWRCPVWILMPNHYHLLLELTAPNLSVGMHRRNTRLAVGFNRRHDLDGHLFQDRFWSEPILRQEHLVEVARYIPANPHRAGLCVDALDWLWGSLRSAMGLTSFPAELSSDWALGLFGPNVGAARDTYLRFVREAPPKLQLV
jgi:REP element-mobilizing transposase RayT